MNIFGNALDWLTDPEHWRGSSGFPTLILAHVEYTLLSLAIAALIAVPAGWAIGHTGRGRGFAVALAGAARALPSLGLLTFLVLILGVALKTPAALFVLVVLAIPSILAGAYAGVEAAPRAAIDSARAMGMTSRQILFRVEVPLGLPLLLGGIRNACLQVVSTVTIAAFIGLPNLGITLIRGLRLGRYEEMLAGALLIAALALLFDAVLALAQRFAVPPGVLVAQGRRTRRSRQRATDDAPPPAAPAPSKPVLSKGP